MISFSIKYSTTPNELRDLFMVLNNVRRYTHEILSKDEFSYFYYYKRFCFRMALKTQIVIRAKRRKITFGLEIAEFEAVKYITEKIPFENPHTNVILQTFIEQCSKQIDEQKQITFHNENNT